MPTVKSAPCWLYVSDDGRVLAASSASEPKPKSFLIPSGRWVAGFATAEPYPDERAGLVSFLAKDPLVAAALAFTAGYLTAFALGAFFLGKL